jgi:hypothetical protein
MKATDEKKDYEFPNYVQKVFHLLSFKDADSRLVGSNSMRFNYPNDYDLFTVVHSNESFKQLKKDTMKTFQNMMVHVLHMDDIYFSKFIAGATPDQTPVYWEPHDVINGHVTQDGVVYKLIDILDNVNGESVIKIDIIAYIEGMFVPFSNVYYFESSDGHGINQDKITLDTVDSLKVDIKKYYDEKYYMKVLKRLFIMSRTTRDKKLEEKCISIFQGDIGKLYQVKSYLECLTYLLKRYHDKDVLKKVENEMQSLKVLLSSQTAYNVPKNIFERFDRVGNATNMKKNIQFLEDRMAAVVNRLVLKSIKSLRISFKRFL